MKCSTKKAMATKQVINVCVSFIKSNVSDLDCIATMIHLVCEIGSIVLVSQCIRY